MRIAKAIWFLIILILAGMVAGFAWLLNTSYTDLITLAIDQLQRPDLREVLEQKYFTEDNFIRLRRTGYSIIPILLGVIGFCIVLRKKIMDSLYNLLKRIRSLYYSVIHSIRESNKHTKIILAVILLLVLFRSVYYALYYHAQYDECWNYNYFLSNNILSSLFAYNNYPLHNFLTYIVLTVLPDATFTMRLPNIILGLVNSVLIFSLAKRIFKKEAIALTAVALFAVLPTTVFYMLFARGVMLALFFGIIILYFFFIRKFENCNKTEATILILVCSLGAYSMISFPVFVAIIFILGSIQAIIHQNWKGLKTIIITGVTTMIIGLILYLPMMLGTGMNLNAASGYFVKTINWDIYLDKATFVSRNQIGFYIGSYIFLAFNAALLFLSKRRFVIVFNIVLLLIPFVFPLLSKTYLPARALGFQVFGYLFTLLLILELIYQKSNTIVFAVTSLVIVIGFNIVSVTHTFFTWSARQDKGAYEIAQVLQENNIESYYDQTSEFQYFVPAILYHHKIADKAITFYSSNRKSSRYTPIVLYDGNTYVINKKRFSADKNKEILYEYTDEDRAFIVYRMRPSQNSTTTILE